MLFAHKVVNALFGPLQRGMKRLGRIAVNLAASKLPLPVFDTVMGSKTSADDLIGMVLVAHQVSRRRNRALDKWFQIRHSVVCDQMGLDRPLAFNGCGHAGFGGAMTALVFDSGSEPGLAAKILFVHLDDPLQHGEQTLVNSHQGTQGMLHLPRGLLGDADQVTIATDDAPLLEQISEYMTCTHVHRLNFVLWNGVRVVTVNCRWQPQH